MEGKVGGGREDRRVKMGIAGEGGRRGEASERAQTRIIPYMDATDTHVGLNSRSIFVRRSDNYNSLL